MKRYLPLASFALATTMLIACDGGEEPESTAASSRTAVPEESAAPDEVADDVDPECSELTRGAVMTLKRTLVQRLGQAMAESPEAAVEVCAREAETIRARIQQETGVELGRASSRLRNHAVNGNPPPWVQSYLADHAGGEEPAEWSQHTEGEARRISPLIAGALCLTCHGEEMTPPVLAAIDEHYPNDEARGYHAGDLRGVVWATTSCDE